MRFEHEIELPRFRQIFAAAVWALVHSLFFDELIETQMRLARATIDHWIGETFHVSRRLQDFGMRQDCAVHPDDIVALVHHDTPPVVLQVPLELDAERAVIPRAVQTAVNLTRLKDEPTSLTQADDLFHTLDVGRRAHAHHRLDRSESVVEAFVPNAFSSAV